MHFPRGQRFFERFAVHPSHHEYATARGHGVRGLLHDNGDEAVGVEFEVGHAGINVAGASGDGQEVFRVGVGRRGKTEVVYPPFEVLFRVSVMKFPA